MSSAPSSIKSHFLSPMQSEEITKTNPETFGRAKVSYCCRRVPVSAMKSLICKGVRPKSGDLVLAEITSLKQHKRIEQSCGRRAHLHIGDKVVLAYGNRYAPDQFEAYMPEDLSPCHMVAAGGIASLVYSKHGAVKGPTQITPLGLVGDDLGHPLNLKDWAVKTEQLPEKQPEIYAVVGTSMNAGKTTTAAHLIKGLNHSGLKVGAAKLTGTGAGLDVWQMKDSGAVEVLDFTDAGFSSTFLLSTQKLELIFTRLLASLCILNLDAVVFEVADGVLQNETAALLQSPVFQKQIDHILFAASDALGAKAGVEWLQQNKLPVKAVSGALTASPLAIRETKSTLDLPVLKLNDLVSIGNNALFNS